MTFKARIAQVITPAIRLLTRYFPFLRPILWNSIVGPQLSWRDYHFEAKTNFGARIRGSTADTIQRYIYYFGTWEPVVETFLRSRLRPGITFLDLGANIGYFTLLAASKVGHGRVIAIEASRVIYERLQTHVVRNGMDHVVRCIHAAVADQTGTLTLYAGEPDNIGTASLLRSAIDGASEQVPAFPLPELLTEEEILAVRLIKIDVEGAEGLVIRGMERMWPHLSPDCELLVELSPSLCDTERIIQTFSELGWNAFALEPKDSIENYLHPPHSVVATRITQPLTQRVDVLFSQLRGPRLVIKSARFVG